MAAPRHSSSRRASPVFLSARRKKAWNQVLRHLLTDSEELSGADRECLKAPGEGFPIAMNALDNSRIGIAAQALGIAQGAYETALNYAQQRTTFGKPISRHQAIGNYLADMATKFPPLGWWSTKHHGLSKTTTTQAGRGTRQRPRWQNF